jgi:hypothetical protein
MMYDVIQIRVGQHQIGIIGLKEVLTEVAQTMTGAPDEIIQKELLTWLSKRNYITNNAIDQYEQAFLGEYKKLSQDIRDENGGSAASGTIWYFGI